jgi:hypothetical protein
MPGHYPTAPHSQHSEPDDHPEADRSDRSLFDNQLIHQINDDIINIPLQPVGDLLNNPVGSDKAKDAVSKLKEYSNNTGTRLLLSKPDGEVVLDTIKGVDQHETKDRKNIHENITTRAAPRRALDSEKQEFHTEKKLSNTTGQTEIYSASRLGKDKEDPKGVVRGSRPSYF